MSQLGILRERQERVRRGVCTDIRVSAEQRLRVKQSQRERFGAGDHESLWMDASTLCLQGEFQESAWEMGPHKCCHGSGQRALSILLFM